MSENKPSTGYIVRYEDGREVRCATIDEANKLRDEAKEN